MITDILLIIGLVVFTIIGACTRLNKTSRKVCSLLASFGLSVFMVNMFNNYLLEFDWYQTAFRWIEDNNTLMYAYRVLAITLSTLLMSFIINLLFKAIELAFKDAGVILPRLCGATIAFISGLSCVVAVFIICDYFNVRVDAPIINKICTYVLNNKI